MNKRIYYALVFILQGATFISSLASIILWFVKPTNDLFLGSIYLFFVPLQRYMEDGNLLEILVLLIFISVSVLLYLLSFKEVFDENKKKPLITICNMVWILFSGYISFNIGIKIHDPFVMYLFNENYLVMFVPGIIFIMFGLLILIRWKPQGYLRNHTTLRKNDYYVEESKFKPTGYEQIKRTAIGVPVLSTACVILSWLFWYLNFNDTKIRCIIYLVTLIFGLIGLFGTIIDCKGFEKRTGQKPPTKNFLKNLILIQCLSIVLLVVSFIPLCFV